MVPLQKDLADSSYFAGMILDVNCERSFTKRAPEDSGSGTISGDFVNSSTIF